MSKLTVGVSENNKVPLRFVFCLATAADRYQSLYAQVAKR
jgi:hypothetical protein